MSILEINKECLNCWFARVCIGWSSSHYGIIVMNVLTSIEKIELVVSFPSLFLDSRKGSRICGSPFWSDLCKFLLEVHMSKINILPTFILQTNNIGIVWQTVKSITNEIWEFKGYTGYYEDLVLCHLLWKKNCNFITSITSSYQQNHNFITISLCLNYSSYSPVMARDPWPGCWGAGGPYPGWGAKPIWGWAGKEKNSNV